MVGPSTPSLRPWTLLELKQGDQALQGSFTTAGVAALFVVCGWLLVSSTLDSKPRSPGLPARQLPRPRLRGGRSVCTREGRTSALRRVPEAFVWPYIFQEA